MQNNNILTRKDLNDKGLYRETKRVVIPASDTESNSVTVTANRGDVRAVGIICAGGTDIEYSEVEIVLDDNGKSFLQKDNLLAYAPSYRSKEMVVTPILLHQNGKLNYSFKNIGVGATMVAVIVLFYYNPFDDNLR